MTRTSTLARTAAEVTMALRQLDAPLWIVRDSSGVGATTDETAARRGEVLAAVGPMPPEQLGHAGFRSAHRIRAAYAAGAMANGIASPAMVIALSRAGYLGSYGAAGVIPAQVERAIAELSTTLGDSPFAVNLIHSPSEPALERAIVDSCLRNRVRCIEASAFMDLSREVVRYRVSGLARGPHGAVKCRHHVIAKVSRSEVAELFMRPAPESIVRNLLDTGEVTAEQAELSRRVPMADDLTAEADSGGHTDRRPLVVLLPELLATRDRMARQYPDLGEVRVGAAGGIGTPHAAAAAFMMGAAYVVTGSINQASLEADQSSATKQLLATAGTSDYTMAPSADMFELGVQVQVLRRGTMFAARAQRLYDLYRDNASLDAIPPAIRADLETSVFRRPLDAVWQDCVAFFERRDPGQLDGAVTDPKRKMALIFRWYLGLSSGWSIRGEEARELDYQIWSGPALGAFNSWVAGTYLAAPAHRSVSEIGRHIMTGAAYQTRVSQLTSAGVRLPAKCTGYVPNPE